VTLAELKTLELRDSIRAVVRKGLLEAATRD
jgi:hypothetical protein